MILPERAHEILLSLTPERCKELEELAREADDLPPYDWPTEAEVEEDSAGQPEGVAVDKPPTKKPRPLPTGSCLVCKGSTLERDKGALYCSPKCAKTAEQAKRNAKRNGKGPRQDGACKICKASLVGRHATARYCSESCRGKAIYRRAMERQAAPPQKTQRPKLSPTGRCHHCDASTDHLARRALYCSRLCQSRAYEASQGHPYKGPKTSGTCRVCSGSLVGRPANARQCSAECTQIAARRAHAARQAAAKKARVANAR